MKTIQFTAYMLLVITLLQNHASGQQVYSEVPILFENGVAKSRTIIVAFNQNIIPTEAGVSVVDTTRFPIRHAGLKNLLRQLSNRYGSATIRKTIPRLVWGDTLVRNLQTGRLVRVPDLSQDFRISFTSSVPLDSVLSLFQALPIVSYATEPISIVQNSEPNDWYYANGYQWNLTRIQAPQAWDITTGSPSIRIAIIDYAAGLSITSHSDLASKFVAGDLTHNNAHAFNVAGVAGAITNNDFPGRQSVASLGWNASLVAENFTEDGTSTNLPEAIDKARTPPDNARIINFSFNTIRTQNGRSCPGSYPSVEGAIAHAYAAGIILVASAGNIEIDCPHPFQAYPAAYDGVIAVSATTEADAFVEGWNHGDFVTVAAPGTNIWTTMVPNGYEAGYGTSLAAPQVAALAGLILSINENFTRDDVEKFICSTAEKVDQQNNPYDLLGPYGTRNEFLGYGRINAYQALLLALATNNKSTAANATSASSQRKLYRESTGKLHEVFESGNQIYYRNSTTGGTSWQTTRRTSDGSGVNTYPCITMTGGVVIVVWQQENGSEYTVKYSRSTDGGAAWTAPSALQTIFCSSPGPLPTIAGYSDGSLVVCYRTVSSLNFAKSTNGGGSWSATSSLPGSSGSSNNPSSAINTTYWSTPQANLAYSTDVPGGSPLIQYNYYDLSSSSWGSAINVTSVVPSQYAHHANPSLAVSASSSYKTVHVAWDAEDTYSPGTRVLVHREGGFRSFGSQYSVLHYQSEIKPSISGVVNETAWMVYQNNSGSGIWKRYYDGTYWTGSNGTWISTGYNPHISVGSSSAKYLWTDGAASPYQLYNSSETLSKELQGWTYSRALNLIDKKSRSSVSIEFGSANVLRNDKSRDSIDFSQPPADTLLLDAKAVLDAGATKSFTLQPDADSLEFLFSIYGNDPQQFFKSSSGSCAFQLVNAQNGTVIGTFGKQIATSIKNGHRALLALTVPLKSVAVADGVPLMIRPVMEGIRDDVELIASIGHIYSGNDHAVGKVAVSFEGGAPAPLVPIECELEQGYPNPFNPSTTLRYALPVAGNVSLIVYDVLGRKVAELASGIHEAGYYLSTWNASAMASGMYFARFTVTDELGAVRFNKVTKLLLMK